MDSETKNALLASIEKWEANAVAETPEEYLIYGKDCPLCDVHYDLFDEYQINCLGCPVSKATKQSQCSGTPWPSAYYSVIEWEKQPSSTSIREMTHAIARDEVLFLKSLVEAE